MESHPRPPAHPGFSSSVDSRRYTHTFHGHGTLPHGVSRSSGSSHSFGSSAKNQAFNGFRAGLVSPHGSDGLVSAQQSERSARLIAQPIPSVLASDSTPRCASMASADRQMIGDATLAPADWPPPRSTRHQPRLHRPALDPALVQALRGLGANGALDGHI